MPLKHPYKKGYRLEQDVLREFKEAGFEVIRSAGSHGSGDLYVKGIGTIQVKARKSFGIYSLFNGADILVIKADRREPLIVMPLQKFLELLEEYK